MVVGYLKNFTDKQNNKCPQTNSDNTKSNSFCKDNR